MPAPSPPEKSPPEMTVKAVAVGLLLALIFGAANAYLGMKAGQTIAATIPAAVIAIALFRLPHFHGTILEQNIARTAASVFAPKLPSTTTPTFACTCFTSSSVEGRRRVGRAAEVPGWAAGSIAGISVGAGAVPARIAATPERNATMSKSGSSLRPAGKAYSL
jgi:hypothetical protein